MPMDIEFVVHDTFELVRPGWKFAKDLEEAGSAFAQACKENYDMTGTAQPTDGDDVDGEEAHQNGEITARRTSLEDDDRGSSDEGEVSTGGQAKHTGAEVLRFTESDGEYFVEHLLIEVLYRTSLRTIAKSIRMLPSLTRRQTKKNTLSLLVQGTNVIQRQMLNSTASLLR